MTLRKHEKVRGTFGMRSRRRKFLFLERATTPGPPKTHRLWGGAIAEWQGASEGQKFTAKPTSAETDSSDYFGIVFNPSLRPALLGADVWIFDDTKKRRR
jgi:hypothetical protein